VCQFFEKVCCLLLQVVQRLPSKKSLDYPADEGSSNKRKTLNREATGFPETLVCTYILRGFIYRKKVIIIVNVADTCYLQAHIMQLDSQVSRSFLV
jgi:hypothetical protein